MSMADPRFFTVAGPFTLAQIAEISGSTLSDESAGDTQMVDVAPLHDASPEKVTFFDNHKYIESFKITKAGACFMKPEFVDRAPEGLVCLVSPNPYKAYALTAQAFYPSAETGERRADTALIDPSAEIGPQCCIEEGVIIGKNVKIGAGSRIQAYTVVRDGVEIGMGCDIGPHCYLTHCLIGHKVRLHAGVVVGKPGFGFAIDPAGFVSVPQLGRVIIQDGADIGAHTTIDRGAGPDTVIGAGSRIDNLVQIGHNVQTGKGCVIVAQTGISGSTKFGDFVMTGGQSGFAGHLTIGSGARIGAQSGIMRDVPPGSEIMGSPGVPAKQFHASDRNGIETGNQKREPWRMSDADNNTLDAVDIKRIMEMLPHRYPMLLVDKIINIKGDESAVGIKNVTYNEPHFLGHFPGTPIMPGVLIVEAMAQTAGALVVEANGKQFEGKLVYFMAIDDAKFRHPVGPGDVLRLEMTKLQGRRNIWKFRGEGKVEGKICAEATVTAMIVDR